MDWTQRAATGARRLVDAGCHASHLTRRLSGHQGTQNPSHLPLHRVWSSIGFVLGQYDHSRELVVDPEVIFSQISARTIYAVTTDLAGNLYTAWSTNYGRTGPTPGAYA